MSTPTNRSPAARARASASARRACIGLARDCRGASFIEYIIVVGLVAIVAIAAFKTFGAKVVEKINQETTGLDQLQPG